MFSSCEQFLYIELIAIDFCFQIVHPLWQLDIMSCEDRHFFDTLRKK